MTSSNSGMASLFPVYEFRPVPRLYCESWQPELQWLRYADGQWIEDDGQHDLAFIAENLGSTLVLYVDVGYQRNIVWCYLPGHWRDSGPLTHPRANPWHYMLRDGETEWGGDWGRDRHLNRIVGDRAMSKQCGRRSAASGHGPEFRIGDPYIARGLVRRVDTKEVVRFPEQFVCMYCGEIETKPNERAA